MTHYGRVINPHTVATACGVVGILTLNWAHVDCVACIEMRAQSAAPR